MVANDLPEEPSMLSFRVDILFRPSMTDVRCVDFKESAREHRPLRKVVSEFPFSAAFPYLSS